MDELFGDKSWIKSLKVAGSYIEEEEQENDTPQEKCKINMLYALYKYLKKK